MNLIEFPFATLSRQPSMGSIRCKRWLTAPDGRRYQQNWTVQGGSESGLPTEFDERIYVALMAITREQAFADRKVPFSVYRLLQIMGESHDNRHYHSVEGSLERLMRASIVAEGAFWDSEKREVVGMMNGFHLIDRFWLAYKETDRRILKREGSHGYIVWGEDLWRSINAGYMRGLDLALFYSLEMPVARRLYRFLGKKLQSKTDYEIDIFQLSQQLGMARYRYPAKVMEKLRPGLEELERRGVISGSELVRVRGYTRVRFTKGKPTGLALPEIVKTAQPSPDTWQRRTCERHGVGQEQQEIWEKTLHRLQRSVSPSRFRTFLERSLLLELTEGRAVIGLPSEYARSWAEGRLRSAIGKAVREVSRRDVSLEFRVIGAGS